MAGEYEIWLTDDSGVRLAPLQKCLWFSASQTDGGIGFFEMGLPLTFDTKQFIKPDYMVQIWRKPAGGTMNLWRPYFIRKWRYEKGVEDEAIVIAGPDCKDLLRRRIAVGYAGTSYSSKVDYADDMMKEIITQQLGASADTPTPVPTAGTRILAAATFTVAPDVSLGPTLTKRLEFGRLLWPNGSGILSDIQQAAREAGTEVFFDIAVSNVSSTSISFEFRTFTGQPAADMSDLGVVFSDEQGNLRDAYLEHDYTAEVNYVYALGQGEATVRNIQQVYDSTRYGISKWGRCEGGTDARNQSSNNGVRETGRVALEEGRPIIRFGGIPMDTKGSRFGVKWDFGYKVRTKFRGEEFDTIIRAVTLSVNSSGVEKIQARLEYIG